MKLINHENKVFRLSISEYMLPFKPDNYFGNNWLKGDIEISFNKTKQHIELETLQIEELINLRDWIDQLINKTTRSETIFDFIDPRMRFRIWKRGHRELLKFIFHSESKSIYSWDLILNDENLQAFTNQIQETLIKFPIR